MRLVLCYSGLLSECIDSCVFLQGYKLSMIDLGLVDSLLGALSNVFVKHVCLKLPNIASYAPSSKTNITIENPQLFIGKKLT